MDILLSGAASGIGFETRRELERIGHRVFSVDIKPLPLGSERHFIADITDEEALKKVYAVLYDIRFDAIIDIAGVHDMLSFAESDFSRFKRLIDINLLGHVLFNRLFYPLLKSDGRFIVVTSEVAYLDPLPFNGAYSVSKTALDCYAQALRQELNLLGQKVITIRPGAVKTALADGSLVSTQRLADETRLYKPQAKRFVHIAKRFMGTPMNSRKLARLINKVVSLKHPRLVYRVHTNPGLRLMNLLPKRAQCRVIRAILNTKPEAKQ